MQNGNILTIFMDDISPQFRDLPISEIASTHLGIAVVRLFKDI